MSILYLIGRFAARRPWTVIGAWSVAAILVVGASSTFGGAFEDSFGAPGLDSQKAVDLLASTNSEEAGLTAQVVMTPVDDHSTFFGSAEAQRAVVRVQAEVSALPHVLETGDPAGALGDGSWPRTGTISPDGRVAVLRVQYPVMEELAPSDLENLKEVAARANAGTPIQVELRGDLFFAFEDVGPGIGEVVGLAAAVLILLLAFGSVTAMGLPIGTALLGLAIGTSSLTLVAHLVDVPSWAPVLGTMVGLGVVIDYALFLLTRHREHLAQGLSVDEAAGRAVATAGKAVVFAGGTVVISILGLTVAGVPIMTAAAIAISVIVLVMVVASLTLLPALLGLAGQRLGRTGRLGRGGRRPSRDDVPHTSGWQRWREHVCGHPWVYVGAGTLVLVALALPALALRVGIPDDGALPGTRTERRAYDLIADGFGPGINGPLVIAVDFSGDPGIVRPLREAVGSDPGVAAVAAAEVDAGAGVATMVAFPTTGPHDPATVDTVERLRSEVFPAVLERSPARAHVGGLTATFSDVGGQVRERLPWFIAVVVLLSFVLLTIVFRSVVVPLKAAVLNILGIGASYGVLVMVFQWGWGADLIGLESTVPIVSFIPMFMFAILFGLSMDYEVFLLSRVREAYDASGDNEKSVVGAIASTGRVISSAALIMISVFLGFAMTDDPITKMFGLGLATAIFVDATIVRLVLVPAVMKLLGDVNWWLPAWLDHLLPAVRGKAPIRSQSAHAVTEPAIGDAISR